MAEAQADRLGDVRACTRKVAKSLSRYRDAAYRLRLQSCVVAWPASATNSLRQSTHPKMRAETLSGISPPGMITFHSLMMTSSSAEPVGVTRPSPLTMTLIPSF